MNSLVLLSAILATSFAIPQRVHFPRKLNVNPTNPPLASVPKNLVVEEPEPIVEASSFVPVQVQAPTGAVPRDARNYVPNEYEKRQNEAARYEFSSDIDDHISDLTHQRTETRNGLSVMGMYSYSDGYYKHTVQYVADQNGYRVTGMEKVPLADGPKVDLAGTASVSNAAHGTAISYKVHSVPVPGPVAKIVDLV